MTRKTNKQAFLRMLKGMTAPGITTKVTHDSSMTAELFLNDPGGIPHLLWSTTCRVTEYAQFIAVHERLWAAKLQYETWMGEKWLKKFGSKIQSIQ
jgi:hypothetical protein